MLKPCVVVISTNAERDLRRVPRHVAAKLAAWADDVALRGISAVRKIPGFHDEPLRGALARMRSIRLNRGYRAYYVEIEGAVLCLRIERVDHHVY